MENVTEAGAAFPSFAAAAAGNIRLGLLLLLLPGVGHGDAPAKLPSCSTSTLIRTIKWLLLLRALARVSPTALLALAMVTSAAASSMLPQDCSTQAG
jgi:hypothetical protein